MNNCRKNRESWERLPVSASRANQDFQIIRCGLTEYSLLLNLVNSLSNACLTETVSFFRILAPSYLRCYGSERIGQPDVSEWNYISRDDEIRHVGPMAQDFYRLFGVGEDDKHITGIDADGVALAAIKDLHEILESEVEELKKLVHQLVEQNK